MRLVGIEEKARERKSPLKGRIVCDLASSMPHQRDIAAMRLCLTDPHLQGQDGPRLPVPGSETHHPVPTKALREPTGCSSA